MNHFAVIYDKEQRYAEKLTDFLNLSDRFPFEARTFSSISDLEQYCKVNYPEILIVDENDRNLINNLEYKEKIILTKKSTRMEDGTYYIYKYQSVEIIIREIVGFLSESEGVSAILKRKHKMKVVCFYSPIKRVLASTTAIELGRQLSKSRKTLYINLESYSGLEKKYRKTFKKDIADFLYYIEGKVGNIGMLLSGIVENIDGVDILPPFRSQADLIVIPAEKWISMLEKIEENTDYDYLIIDLSEEVQGMFELMKLSDCIITCVDDEDSAINKLEQYKEGLSESGYEEILEKTEYVNILNMSSDKSGHSSERDHFFKKVMQRIADET